jgi:hypothetical protein
MIFFYFTPYITGGRIFSNFSATLAGKLHTNLTTVGVFCGFISRDYVPLVYNLS